MGNYEGYRLLMFILEKMVVHDEDWTVNSTFEENSRGVIIDSRRSVSMVHPVNDVGCHDLLIDPRKC